MSKIRTVAIFLANLLIEHYFLLVGIIVSIVGYVVPAAAGENSISIPIAGGGYLSINLVTVGGALISAGIFIEGYRRLRSRVNLLSKEQREIVKAIESINKCLVRMESHIENQSVHKLHDNLITAEELIKRWEEQKEIIRLEVKAAVSEAITSIYRNGLLSNR